MLCYTREVRRKSCKKSACATKSWINSACAGNRSMAVINLVHEEFHAEKSREPVQTALQQDLARGRAYRWATPGTLRQCPRCRGTRSAGETPCADGLGRVPASFG